MKTNYSISISQFGVCIASLLFTTPLHAQSATEILNVSGVKGGLIVHVGCGEGSLTTALADGTYFLVQALDRDAQKVAVVRESLRSNGVYGKASVRQFDGKRLPYTDNLVNLLIAEDLGDVSMDEVFRVLNPGGVALVLESGQQTAKVRNATTTTRQVKIGDRLWAKTVKPWPVTLGEWTHFLQDASNNAVAQDRQVGPPRRLKWTCGPLWSRSHEFNSSLCAMVSAHGRIFYIYDEGLTSITDSPIPQRWTLIARDAFNGLLLWKRRIPEWGAGYWKSRALRSVPLTIPRLLVAQGDRVFFTLGYGAAVSVLDAATGTIQTTYEETEGTEEFRCLDGILVLRRGKNTVIAIDSKTGEQLWKATGKIQPLSLALQTGKVFYQEGHSLVCRQLRGGQESWRTETASGVSLLVVHGDRIVLLGGKQLQAVSADTGKSLWSVKANVRRQELFVAQEQVWHWDGDRLVGRDLKTGEIATRLDTSDVFTPGHHLRCYQTKATENFLITPNRGAEFVSITGGANSENDWVRGACRYGILPCNGLLYVPPNPCFCYPGVKLTGFNVLAPLNAPNAEIAEPRNWKRLERGPAYAVAGSSRASVSVLQPADWAMYRHDARRSGATDCEISAHVAKRWQVRLPAPLTPPVVAGNRVYVAAKDEQTVYALDSADGHPLWHFTAGGRIDSSPTAYQDLVLFGGADGSVYCLKAADGKLVWRFQAAPNDQQIIAMGQLESPWRVHGSILVKEGVAYCTAGRSSYLDGGIWAFGLDPYSGNVLHQAHIDTWARTRDDAKGKPFVPGYHMEGTHSDLLVSEGDFIYLGQIKFDRKLVQQKVPYILPDPQDKTVAMNLANQPFFAEDREPNGQYERRQREWLENTQKSLLDRLRQEYGSYNLGDRQIGRHVISPAGFLDDSWFNRTYWMYSATWPGYYLAHRGAKTGQLLVVGPQKTYALQAFPTRNFQSPLFTPGEKGYLLFADANDNEPVLNDQTRGTTKGWGFTRKNPPVWSQWVPVRVRGMVLAGQHLFVAGPPDVVDPDDPMAAFEGRKGAILHVRAADDGKLLAEYPLVAPPVFDGLIAASGQLFLCTTNGHVVCLN